MARCIGALPQVIGPAKSGGHVGWATESRRRRGVKSNPRAMRASLEHHVSRSHSGVRAPTGLHSRALQHTPRLALYARALQGQGRGLRLAAPGCCQHLCRNPEMLTSAAHFRYQPHRMSHRLPEVARRLAKEGLSVMGRAFLQGRLINTLIAWRGYRTIVHTSARDYEDPSRRDPAREGRDGIAVR